KTVPVWNAIARLKNDNCDIIGISVHSLEETKKFLSSKDVGFYAVSVESDTSFGRKYKIPGVPETILVDANGVVEKSWVGELRPDETKEIEDMMGAHNGTL